MKKLFTLIVLLICCPVYYSQSNCLDESTGLFKYQAKLNIQNLSSNFDKVDFLNFVNNMDYLSNENYQILENSIISLKKAIPSSESNKTIYFSSSIDILNILDLLLNSLENKYCLQTNCIESDGSYNYYVLIKLNDVPIDFDKNSFLNYIQTEDNISETLFDLLELGITNLKKAFPVVSSDFLNRVIEVNSNINLYNIFENDLINSVEYQECLYLCLNGSCLLGQTLNNETIDNEKSYLIYPNPFTDQLVIKNNNPNESYMIEIHDVLGQSVFIKDNFNGSDNILKLDYLEKGIYFLRIASKDTASNEVFKVVKN